MTQLIDHLTELTALRDRDQLDVTLATALGDLLRPVSVAVNRTVGENAGQRWMTRARLERGAAIPTSDPVWVEMESLPLLSAFPLRCAALSGQTVVSGPAGTARNAQRISVFPLISDREAVGVVEIVTDRPLGPSAQILVKNILSIYHNFQSLLDYSERDTLTGLLNRKTFDDSFFKIVHGTPATAQAVTERRQALGDAGSFWLAMLDIDHFKAVNDNFGHLIGDEVLLLLSRVMRSTLRFHDRLYRFGGEEFVIVMRCGDEPSVKIALERLRQATEAYAFPRVGRITVSVGFTEVACSDTPSTALERADLAVYHAKHHGRNQVRSYRELEITDPSEAAENVGEFELF